jgi:hypothetical protein
LTALGESDKLDISPEGRVAQPLKTCAAQLTRSISSR